MTIGDERFLDVLLHETYHPTDVDPILARLFSRLQDQPEVLVKVPHQKQRPIRRQWASAIFVIMASVLMIGFLAMWPAESNATEILHEVIASTETNVDRQYSIETTGRLKLNAMLWVQGGDRFVLRLRALLPVGDEYVWVGSNGSEFWLVPALGPVLKGRHPDWLLAQLQGRHQLSLPILQLSTVTRRLESRYTTPELINDTSDMKHLVTEQKSPATEWLPHRVEIFSKSRIINKLQLLWKVKPGGDAPFQMNLALQQQTTMPADWYEHSAHHAASRRVLSAQENDSP